MARSAPLLALALAVSLLATGAQAQTVTRLGGNYVQVSQVAIDSQSNVFVADSYGFAISEVTAAGGYSTNIPLGNGLQPATSAAIDKSGNLFVVDGTSAKEILAAGGYVTVRTLGSGWVNPLGVAVDSSGNVFVADAGRNQVVEISAASGYSTVAPIGSGFKSPNGVSVDSHGNVIVSDTGNGAVKSIAAAGGYTSVTQLVGDLGSPLGAVLDKDSNLFTVDGGGVTEYTAASSYATQHFLSSDAHPINIAIDAAGNIFVTCTGFGPPIGDPLGSVDELTVAGGYAKYTVLRNYFYPMAITVDASDNLYVTDDGTGGVFELPASGGYKTEELVVGAVGFPTGLALDSAANVFFVDQNTSTLNEIPAAGGYSTVKIIASGLNQPSQLAIDPANNIFVAVTGANVVKEYLAAGGYAKSQTVGAGFQSPSVLALDSQRNLFVLDGNGINKVEAAGGYTSVTAFGGGARFEGVAVDANEDLYLGGGTGLYKALAAGGYTTIYQYFGDGVVAGSVVFDAAGHFFVGGGAGVEEITPPPSSPIAASILPSARSVANTATATAFASMINTGSTPLQNCAVAMPSSTPSFGTITLNYQTTDPATNELIGSPDTPIAISAGGISTFLLAFRYAGIDDGDVPVNVQFTCDGVPPAQTIPGVNTIDLTFFDGGHASADIIAIAATPTNNGIVAVPQGGAAAFSVAAVDVGMAQTLTVKPDTGTTTLPLAVNICQTVPATGQCMAAPTPSVSANFAQNATATFSVFLQATGPIALAPGYARVAVHFETGFGTAGATSVAVESP